MGKIFVGQTKLTINLDTGSLLSGVDVARIKYTKPDATTGEFVATVSGSSIFYNIVNASEIDAEGIWSFYAHITYLDTKIIIGEVDKIRVYNPGE